MPTKDCTSKGIPEHLHTDGRRNSPKLPKNEIIYRWFEVNSKEHCEYLKNIDEFNAPLLSSFLFSHIKNMSCVRKSLTKSPEDVFYRDDKSNLIGAGIISLGVAEIEAIELEVEGDKSRKFTFKVRHRKTPCNYAHCEVKAFDNGKEVDDIKPRSIRTQLKERLMEIGKVVRMPDFCIDV